MKWKRAMARLLRSKRAATICGNCTRTLVEHRAQPVPPRNTVPPQEHCSEWRGVPDWRAQ